MSDNVIILPVITTLDLPADRVLTAAIDADLKRVVVLDYDQDGNEYFCSSFSDGGEVLWLMERLKRQLLES